MTTYLNPHLRRDPPVLVAVARMNMATPHVLLKRTAHVRELDQLSATVITTKTAAVDAKRNAKETETVTITVNPLLAETKVTVTKKVTAARCLQAGTRGNVIVATMITREAASTTMMNLSELVLRALVPAGLLPQLLHGTRLTLRLLAQKVWLWIPLVLLASPSLGLTLGNRLLLQVSTQFRHFFSDDQALYI
jgi:hypothetical protein